jgi:SNF2 family DNA or RNA helicase
MGLRIQKEPPLTAKHSGFAYQVETVEAIKNLKYAAVFHEQGLGKTKIAIDLALKWIQEGVVDSVLVVTKKALIANWESEIRFHSRLSPQIISQNKRCNFFAFNSPARLYVTHYEACISEKSRLLLFQKTRRLAIVCDEAQKFKNPQSLLAKCMFHIASGFHRRLVMTGTPVANRPYDIWSLIFFLDQGKALGTNFEQFRSQHDLKAYSCENEAKREQFATMLEAIFDKLRPFSVRTTKQDANLSLPTKEIRLIRTEFEPTQQELYSRYRDELRAEIIQDGKARLDNAEDILKRLLRLVQVASNPFTVDESYTGVPGKVPELVRILSEKLAPSEKAIVWTSFTDNADWLRNRLKAYGAVAVHGKMTIHQRNYNLDRFKNDPECRVLVATPGAAKEGLTLTVANFAIFFDRSFSLDDYLQAQDRIHRISQEKECFVFNLIMRDSVDEWVDTLLGAKHLAAQLTQGDIPRSRYESEASYEFKEMLKSVLGF